jgi:hypothetical protein
VKQSIEEMHLKKRFEKSKISEIAKDFEFLAPINEIENDVARSTKNTKMFP